MRIRKTRGKLALYIAGLLSIILFFAVCTIQQNFNAEAATVLAANDAANTRFVTLFDNEDKTVLRSDAKTVGELLERAQVTLGDGDKVEPALEEEIKEDNFNINIYRARDLIVIDDMNEMLIRTSSTDPEAIVKDAGVKLLAADLVDLVPYDRFLETGMMTAYKVIRAKTVHLNFNGQLTDIRTQTKTVADFLAEQGIDGNPEINWVSLDNRASITDGLSLSVFFQGQQTIAVEEDIPFAEQTTMDFSLEYGQRVVTQQGAPGKKSVVYDIEMRDGQEISRQYVSEVILVEPVTQYVTIGMKLQLPSGSHEDWMAAVGISSSDFGYVNYIIERESHWNPLARNRSSGATGLCQALPGNKMASAGSDWETNPITQLRWCNGYAVGRYGSWENAYYFWQNHHWW